MTNQGFKETTIRRFAKLLTKHTTKQVDNAAAELTTTQEQNAANAVAEHAIKRTGVHGTGPEFVAKTPRADQRIAWKDVQDKPDLALADFDLDDILSETPANGKAPKAPMMGDPTIDDDWLSSAIARITDLIWSNIDGTPTTLAGYGIIDAQPLDSDLTAIAALSTTSFGRAFLTLADAAAARTAIDAQPLDSDLTAIAALTTTSFGRSLLTQADAAAARATLGVGSGTGTVTSVDIAPPAAGLTVGGSPITSSGTITLTLANDLAALEGLGSTGLAARTATDTWAQRSIAGTSNRLTVSNGDGVAGNPTLDIASTYVGQNTITILGTIATGVWQGTKVDLAYGGTNADLSATGGTARVLKQLSTGAAITVATLTAAEIPDLSATYQPLDGDLTAIAALVTTSFGRSLLTQADAAATRATIGAGTGNGTVTSVGITAPAAGLTVSGSPITTSGAITLTLANDLAALEGLGSTGLAVRTAADAWAQRTITGTANRLTVSNGDGVAGNPTLDIASTYVGQNTITTLGTIATGVWQGTKVGLAYGGTNADLSATTGYLKQATAGANVIPVAGIPSTDLTYSGLTTGQVLRATSATAAAFGALDLANASAVTGQLAPANGGMGVNNGIRTLVVQTFGGTLNFSAASLTLTVPASGTAALLATTQTFSAVQTFSYSDASDTPAVVVQPASTSQNGSMAFRLSNNANFEFFRFENATAGLEGYFGFIGASSTIPNRAGSVEFGTVNSHPLDFRPNDTLRFRMLGGGGLEMYEQTAPAAGAADTARLFVRDNGSGKTQVCVIFNTGAIQVIATQP